MSPLRVKPTVRVAARLAVAALVLVLVLGQGACGSAGRVQTCGEIPTEGCPAGRGGTCDDATCRALYDCVDGDWTEVETCPETNGTAGAGGAAGAGGGDGAGGCDPVAIDRTGESRGCEPDLLEPDCPAAAAEVCSDPCATGCVDFYLCLEQGWVDVAACDEDGTFRITR